MMRITFNLMNCGLGNNGGSFTIIKSANMLKELGHEVFIIDTSRNMHTWTPLKARHIVVRNEDDIPSADAIIATGFNTVKTTMRLPKRCGKKFHWIRGWEVWNMSESQIMKDVLEPPIIKIVNSYCLFHKLSKIGFDSEIVRPGHDFNDLYPTNNRKENKIILGGLFATPKHHTTKRTDWITEASRLIKNKFEHKKIELWMFGSVNNPKIKGIDKYIQQPSIEEKNRFYNNVHIWLAPSSLEGLHIPPAEALLTECPVVTTNAPLSGTQDYVIHDRTGLVAEDNLRSFVRYIEKLVRQPRVRARLGAAGRLKVLELGDRKLNMRRMVDVLEGTIKVSEPSPHVYVYKLDDILREIQESIVKKKPFSLIRFGDGGIKLIHSVLYSDKEQLDIILLKEGIPKHVVNEVLEQWTTFANSANFIDSPVVYFSDKFWPRYKAKFKQMSSKTTRLLKSWKELYSEIGFKNTRYCNPEVNFLMVLRRGRKQNLLSIMEGRKVGLITTFPEVCDKLREAGYDVDAIQIVGQYEEHYRNSYDFVIRQLKEISREYDLWLVAAGELGRVYSGLIKDLGGIAIDIGFLVEYWAFGEIPIRLEYFVEPYLKNDLELQLTFLGEQFARFL